jgi:hypothetical protein
MASSGNNCFIFSFLRPWLMLERALISLPVLTVEMMLIACYANVSVLDKHRSLRRIDAESPNRRVWTLAPTAYFVFRFLLAPFNTVAGDIDLVSSAICMQLRRSR